MVKTILEARQHGMQKKDEKINQQPRRGGCVVGVLVFYVSLSKEVVLRASPGITKVKTAFWIAYAEMILHLDLGSGMNSVDKQWEQQ